MTTPAPALGGAVAAYLKQLRTESTKRTYSNALDPMVARFGKNTPLASLDALEVSGWFAEQWGQTSDRTQQTRQAPIRSAALWWKEQGWITSDPASALKRPTRPRSVQPGEHYTYEEVQALLGACDRRTGTGVRSRALIMLLYRSGLRIGEALAARPGDFNFRTHSVLLRETKSGEAQTAGWHPSADGDLMRWLDKRRALGIRQATMFCGTDGKPVSQSSFRRTLGRLAARAGIQEKRIHPHAFRHTFAIELRRAGVPLEDIQALLRHSSLVTTQLYLKQHTNSEAVGRLQLADLPEVGGDKPEEPESEIAALRRQLEDLEKRMAGEAK